MRSLLLRAGLGLSLLAIVFVGAIAMHPTQAFAAASGEACTTDDDCDGALACVSGKCSVDASLDPAATPATPTVTPTNTTAPATSSSECHSYDPSTYGTCILDTIGGVLLTIANFFLGAAGVLLNYVVVKTVFQFATYFGNSPGLLISWTILRDIGNLMILFGFVFLGVKTILNLDDHGSRRALVGLVIFATLLNFSLFASEAIIDASNLVSSVMYSQANSADNCLGASGLNSNGYGDCAINYGIAGHIMQKTGLSTMFAAQGSGGSIVIFLVLATFAMVGAVVLFATAVMLAIRAIVLVGLIISSPIGFAGMAIPQFQGMARQWWSALFSQSFFAPVLLLCILISLKISDTFNAGQNAGLAAAIENQYVSNMGIIMVFTLVIGFLIGSLVIAKKFGSAGGTFAVNMGARFAFGGTTRFTNFAVGGSSQIARKAIQKSRFRDTTIARTTVNRVLRPLEGANLDLRRTPVGGLLRTAGATTGANPSSHASFKDMQHEFHDFKDGKARKELNAQYDAEVRQQKLESEAHDESAGHGTMSDESKRYLASLSEKELTELHGIKAGVDAMVKNLTSEQFDKLMKSKDLSDIEKGKVRDARFRPLLAAVQNAEANPADPAAQDAAKKAVKALSGKDIAQLAQSPNQSILLSNEFFSSNLSEDQFTDAKKNNDLSTSQKTVMETARKARFSNTPPAGAPAGTPTRLQQTITAMNAEAIAKLAPEVILQKNALGLLETLPYMSGRQIAAIDPDKLDPTQLADLRTFIQNARAAGSPAVAEFDRLKIANPKVKQRWDGIV